MFLGRCPTSGLLTWVSLYCRWACIEFNKILLLFGWCALVPFGVVLGDVGSIAMGLRRVLISFPYVPMYYHWIMTR